MRPGDPVRYVLRPEWGVGTIERPTPDGLLIVVFPEAGEDTFHPLELELASVKAAV